MFSIALFVRPILRPGPPKFCKDSKISLVLSPCAMLLTLALTWIETIDPGDYQRTIRHTGYLQPERAFLTCSTEGDAGLSN